MYKCVLNQSYFHGGIVDKTL